MKRRIIWIILILCAICGGWLLLRQTVVTADPSTYSAESLGFVLEESADGLTILAVRHHSPAERVGLAPGDLLLMMNDTSLESIDQLDRLLSLLHAPCRITCKALHDDQLQTYQLTMKH